MKQLKIRKKQLKHELGFNMTLENSVRHIKGSADLRYMRLLLLCRRVACQNVPAATPTLHQIVALAAKVSANVSSLLGRPSFDPRRTNDVAPSVCSD